MKNILIKDLIYKRIITRTINYQVLPKFSKLKNEKNKL